MLLEDAKRLGRRVMLDHERKKKRHETPYWSRWGSLVQQAGDGSRFVWTVRGDSAVRTAVTTGRLVNNGIVLTGGVAAGDRIVVDGMQKIGEGSKVVW